MHYRRWSVESSAPPVAVVEFLPGSGQHSGHYHHLGRTLAAGGIDTWCLDPAGQGLSEGDPQAPGTLVELAADAVALGGLIRRTVPAVPYFLAGHSLGAATCLAAAVLPESSGCAGLIITGTPKRATALPVPADVAILALHGADDRRAPIQAVRDWTVGHRSVGLREYADAGHDLLHEPVRAAVTADIAEWIRERAAHRHGAAEVG